MHRRPSAPVRHPLRLSLQARRGVFWRIVGSDDVRDFLLAYMAGVVAFSAFLA